MKPWTLMTSSVILIVTGAILIDLHSQFNMTARVLVIIGLVAGVIAVVWMSEPNK